MGKSSDAVSVLANAALSLPLGAQVPTTTELARLAGTGAGTVQAALRTLELSGAIRTSSHGSSGRRLTAKVLPDLWAASGRGVLTGVLPLPDTREFAGLATGLSEAAERAGLPLQLLFRQGSAVRLRFLESKRVDFTVASAAVAHSLGGQTTSLTLGPHTFYRKQSVVVITRTGQEVGKPTRVPVDRNSTDHVTLTRREFPDADMVDTPYAFIPESVVNGDFEAAVWHQSNSSPLLVAAGIRIHALQHPPTSESEALDRASIMWSSNDAAVGGIIRGLFDPATLETVQKEVMDGRRIPQF